jgi:hypothetical protein
VVKDMLGESGFDAGPGHVVPGRLGQAVSGFAHRPRDRAAPGRPTTEE